MTRADWCIVVSFLCLCITGGWVGYVVGKSHGVVHRDSYLHEISVLREERDHYKHQLEMTPWKPQPATVGVDGVVRFEQLVRATFPGTKIEFEKDEWGVDVARVWTTHPNGINTRLSIYGCEPTTKDAILEQAEIIRTERYPPPPDSPEDREAQRRADEAEAKGILQEA